MEVTICIPTLKRYDKLLECIHSAEEGTVKPVKYSIIDNGTKLKFDTYFSKQFIDEKISIYNPGKNIGVASSWNWFIKNEKQLRIICNDDVKFFPDTIEILLNHYDDNLGLFPAGVPSTNAFSCFVLGDKLIEKVGLFDEEFYPAYYEDNSYYYRLTMAGFRLLPVDCRLDHFASSTMKYYSSHEMTEHNIRFCRNTELYRRMWGGMPGYETFTVPFNGEDKNRIISEVDSKKWP